MAIGGVKSKETRSYQKGKCNSPIFSTETTHALEMCLILSICIRVYTCTHIRVYVYRGAQITYPTLSL